MPGVGVKIYSVFFKLLLRHRLQAFTAAAEEGGDADAFGVSCRPDEATVPSNPAFVADGVASKDLHIDPNSALSIRIFLPTLPPPPHPHHLNPRRANDPTGGAARASYRGYLPPVSSPRAAASARRKLPIIVQFHGGGFVTRSKSIVLQREPGVSSKSIVLQIDSKWQQVLCGILCRIGSARVRRGRTNEISLKLRNEYRIFVMPSRMCLSSVYNTKGTLHSSNATSKQRFMECKNRKNRSSVMSSYTFLPSMPSQKLRDAANKMKEILGDYDAIHVRRGDLLKNRKDRFGVERSLHPYLDRNTHPKFIRKRIAKWTPPGRTLYIASNERAPGFFSPLSDRYKLAYASNFSRILELIIENNYQLFMVERQMMRGAKTFVKTMKEFDNDLTLCDDPKKNTKIWEKPQLE